MPLITGDKLAQFGQARTCQAADCHATLSRYNPSVHCASHAGWQEPVRPRTRRR